MVPLAVLCGWAIGTFTARTRSSRIVSRFFVMDLSSGWSGSRAQPRARDRSRTLTSRYTFSPTRDGGMPRRADATKRRIIEVAYDLFYRDGFARAGVDAIAEAAGITKRTLYYHYESKDALLAAVLDVQHEIMLSRIQRWASRASGDPATMVEIVFAEFAAWAKKHAWKGSGFTRVAMELADMPGHPARAAARRQKAAIEGCLSLVLIHGDTSYAEAAAAAARQLVERDRLDPPSRQPSPEADGED